MRPWSRRSDTLCNNVFKRCRGALRVQTKQWANRGRTGVIQSPVEARRRFLCNDGLAVTKPPQAFRNWQQNNATVSLLRWLIENCSISSNVLPQIMMLMLDNAGKQTQELAEKWKEDFGPLSTVRLWGRL